MFLRSIAGGSKYCIRSLWINARTYNLSFHFSFSFFLFSFFFFKGGGRVMGKEGARFEVVP